MILGITRPTLLINEINCRRNIHKMAKKARTSGVGFRPHFKTHQSAEIGGWFRDEGVTEITVSSVQMAHYFTDYGWTDITIAFPYNPLECEIIETLAKKIRLKLLVESVEALSHINQNIDADLDYWIKIDVGTHRTGIPSTRFDELLELSNSKNKKHSLVGLLSHAGHSYKKQDANAAQAIYEESVSIMEEAKGRLDGNLLLSYGDTPTCSILDSFPGVNEIRPGNFVFYDLMQNHFGSCKLGDIGICMACPVVAVHKDRNEAVIYGGAVHFSKDVLPLDSPIYGLVIRLKQSGEWDTEPLAKVIRLSQEHGIIKGEADFIHSLKIGELIGVLPIHSCLTADLQSYYLSLTGKKIKNLKSAVI